MIRDKKFLKNSLFVTLVFVIGLMSCEKKDAINSSPDVKLGFSMDTVMFDTVFSTVGSTTKDFRIYNNSSSAIEISSITLARGNKSQFRINVDGVSGTDFSDIKIYPNDSLYVFVRVTIDPTEENLPFVCQDSIIFETNTNFQDVDLVAWGQNAHFYKNVLLQGNHIWTADKPYVVYGYVVVDDTLNSSLTIESGATVYMHSNAVIAVDSSASLKINGTFENPVTIEGDRLESWYDHIPGQWNSIWLAAGSIENEINYAIIRNGIVGVRVDTIGSSTEPTLKINNSIIHNMQGYGVFAQGSKIEARNSVFSNCGIHAVALSIGGDYDFRHCTIGNYWNYSARQSSSLALNNYYIYNNDTIARDLDNAYFGNCIVYGDIDEELAMSKTTLAEFNYSFENCIVKTSKNFSADNAFTNCFSKDPVFSDPVEYDFRLDTILSPAVNAGNIEIINNTIGFDLSADQDNNSRVSDQAPDLGAYEFVEEEE